MRMGTLEFVKNRKEERFEADYYYDTKLQNEDGDEFYVRFTAVEVRNARNRGKRQLAEIQTQGMRLGHTVLVKNEVGPRTEAPQYFDVHVDLVFPKGDRREDAFFRFTVREMKRGIERGLKQSDEITKTSWFQDLFD